MTPNPIESPEFYEAVFAIGEHMLTPEDQIIDPDDMQRIRTIQAGDPVGDYAGFVDIQLAIIKQEKAYRRMLADAGAAGDVAIELPGNLLSSLTEGK